MNLDAFPPVLTPTGEPVIDAPPHKFPAYIQLQAKSALLNALVGRLSWDDPRVRAEQRIILDPTLDNEYEAFRDSFEELEEFEREVFGAKSYFLAKERGRGRLADDLEYPEDPSSDLEDEDDPVGMTSSAHPLTEHGSEGYTKGEDAAVTPQGAGTTALNLGPDIFDDKAVPMEIDRELKDPSKPEEDGFRDATPEQSSTVVSTLEDTDKLAVLHRPTPSPISERGAASREQAIDSSILQSPSWKKMQAEMRAVRERASLKL
jgi:hypothetical protein